PAAPARMPVPATRRTLPSPASRILPAATRTDHSRVRVARGLRPGGPSALIPGGLPDECFPRNIRSQITEIARQQERAGNWIRRATWAARRGKAGELQSPLAFSA